MNGKYCRLISNKSLFNLNIKQFFDKKKNDFIKILLKALITKK